MFKCSILTLALLFSVVWPCLQAQQPPTPSIDTANVWWGGFELNMTGNSPGIANTEWVVTNPGGDTLFDSWRQIWRNNCDHDWRPLPPYAADTRDLTHKKIIGCLPGQILTARVRYNNGASDWSATSATRTFTLPQRPAPKTNDTVRIILWGESFLRYDDGCIISKPLFSPTPPETDDTLSDGFLPLFAESDTYGHALQTLVQRLIPDTTIIAINCGISGSYQHDWIYWNTPGARNQSVTDSSRIALYDPGERFSNIAMYPIAVFSHTHNDVGSDKIPPSVFAMDIDSIVNRLTGLGVRVVYNSIHFAAPKESYPLEQYYYYAAWDSLMNLKARKNPRLWKGIDYYHLFLNDTARYARYDGEHPNVSEGVPGVVTTLADTVALAIRNIASGVKEGADPMGSLALSCTPNPLNNAAVIRYSLSKPGRVNLSIVDPTGRVVENLLDADEEAGQHFYQFDATAPFASGAYLCRLEAGGRVETKTVFVVR